MKQGDNPEFPNMGRSAGLCVGSNINAFEYGLLIKQLDQTFSTDDSITNFKVTNFMYDGTDLLIEYKVDSFYNFSHTKIIQS
jgi:hypothetical protein